MPVTQITAHEKTRAGCPRILCPAYETVTKQGRRTLTWQTTAMALVHLAKDKREKSRLPLGGIHHELYTESLKIERSGASNVLLGKVSFNCLIGTVRKHIVFNLRIPGVNTNEHPVLSYSSMEKKYDFRENLLEAIDHFYTIGRVLANPLDKTHGNRPGYDPDTSKHDRYINHTEQMLISYLGSLDGVTMLVNRLRTHIRGEFPEERSAKIYSMGLHLHSTKTCCAPCEYTLLGFMNDKEGTLVNGDRISFLKNFFDECAKQNDRFAFTFPIKSSFRTVVTVTAVGHDADHKADPLFIRHIYAQKKPHDILIKSDPVHSHVYTTRFDLSSDKRRNPQETTLSGYTVFISGSDKTKGTPKTKGKVTKLREEEESELAEKLAFLSIKSP